MSEKRTSSLTLVGNNTLVYVPDPKDEKTIKAMRANFGWMGEDYRQTILNGDIENAIPKEEDFLPFWFRHISATTVGGGSWKATEFPEKVLKAGMNLLAFKPSYVNHELETSNIIGGVGDVKWSGKTKLSDGTVVPPGIDAPIWIDGKLHPDICRKLAAFPVPHIQSVSVTVTYEWEPSHVFEDSSGQEDIWLFENRIGQTVNGEMVRRIATKIIDFYETSLVWLGADPFAKILDADGKPMNIEKSAIVGLTKEFNKDPLNQLYKDTGRYFVNDSCFVNLNKLDLQRHVIENIGKTENFSRTLPNSKKTSTNFKNDLEMELKEFIAQQLGCKPDEVTVDKLKEFSFVKSAEHTTLVDLQKLVGSKSDFETLKSEKDKAEADLVTANETIEGLKTEKTANEPLVTFATDHKTKLKDEAVRLYKVANADKVEDSIVSMIGKAADDNDFKLLNGLIVQYGGKAFGEFEGECSECGCKEIKLRSSEGTEGGGKDEGTGFPNLSDTFRK